MAEPFTGIIIQARMGSTRLPGKSLRKLANRPLIGHAIERLKRCARPKLIVLATTDRMQDDALAAYGRAAGVMVFRGDESDVLSRYYLCAKEFGLDHIVRATGDNPFVDPIEVDRLIELQLEAGSDFAESFSGGLPIGVGSEIMTCAALESSYHKGRAPDHREHVDEYILQNRALFRLATLTASADKYAPTLSFTVDTADEFYAAERLFHGPFLGKDPCNVTTEMLVAGSHSLRGRPA